MLLLFSFMDNFGFQVVEMVYFSPINWKTRYADCNNIPNFIIFILNSLLIKYSKK